MSRDWARGWLWWFAHPSAGVECKEQTLYPALLGTKKSTLFLLQALQKWQLGFWVFFVSFVQNLPQLRMHGFVFCFLFFFVFSILEDRFVFSYRRTSLCRFKHCSTAAKGPRSPNLSQNVSFICLHCHLCVRFMLHEVFTSIISFNLCFQETILKKRNLKVSKLTSSLKSLS